MIVPVPRSCPSTLVTSSPTMKPARYASESDMTADTLFISSTSRPHGSSASRASRSVTTVSPAWANEPVRCCWVTSSAAASEPESALVERRLKPPKSELPKRGVLLPLLSAEARSISSSISLPAFSASTLTNLREPTGFPLMPTTKSPSSTSTEAAELPGVIDVTQLSSLSPRPSDPSEREMVTVWRVPLGLLLVLLSLRRAFIVNEARGSESESEIGRVR
mmetsp:Transcript_22954/g.54938  ORF Transcript_22954/g.54938 Transcript_22954/m.54938 type:complete len:221 (+) Transcript_22954:327-989(+)